MELLSVVLLSIVVNLTGAMVNFLLLPNLLKVITDWFSGMYLELMVRLETLRLTSVPALKDYVTGVMLLVHLIPSC